MADESLAAELAGVQVADLVGGLASTLAGVGYAKLGAGDLEEAKRAIDALAALVPLLEGEAKRDLGAALADLQVGYAKACSDRTL